MATVKVDTRGDLTFLRWGQREVSPAPDPGSMVMLGDHHFGYSPAMASTSFGQRFGWLAKHHQLAPLIAELAARLSDRTVYRNRVLAVARMDPAHKLADELPDLLAETAVADAAGLAAQ